MINSFAKLSKEIIIFALIIGIAMNVMSVVRSPTLDSQKLPSFQGLTINQNRLDQTRLYTQPTIIYFWGSWCSVCTVQSPVIDRLKDEANIISIAVHSGRDDDLIKMMKSSGYSFQTYNDSNGVWSQKFKVKSFPTLFIYDQRGHLQFTEVGYTTTLGLKARLTWLKLGI